MPRLLLRTTKVCMLELCDLLIIEWDRSTPVSLFTHEVIPRRWLMTTDTRGPKRQIDDLVSPISDLCACLGDLQGKKFPAIRVGKFLMWVLYHGFKRNQLEDGADGILLVRHAVSEDMHRLLQFLRI